MTSRLVLFFLLLLCPFITAQASPINVYVKLDGKITELTPSSSPGGMSQSFGRLAFNSVAGIPTQYINFDYGNVSTSRTLTFLLGGGEAYVTQSYSFPAKTGSDAFQITRNNCSGSAIPTGAICEFDIAFTPFEKGEYVATYTITFTDTYEDGSQASGEAIFTVTGRNLDVPVEKSACEIGSIINITNQSLGEVVPVAGTGLNLHYTTELSENFLSTYAVFRSQFSFNKEGWTNSLQHFYQPLSQRLFLGTGAVRERKAEVLDNGNLLIAHLEQGEVYIFSPAGQHLETRTSLTGTLKYQFIYSLENLVEIKNAFNQRIQLVRNANGVLTKIIAPFGQETLLGTDENGRIISITNPNNETYLMSYKAGTSLLESFTNPGGQISQFHYDSNGKLIKDLGAGGNFWSLITIAGGVIKSSALNRQSAYSMSRTNEGYFTQVETNPAGIQNVHSEDRFGNTNDYNNIQALRQSQVPDERFNLSDRRVSRYENEIQGVVSATQYSQNVVYPSDVSPNHFNFSNLAVSTLQNGKEFKYLFEKSTKTQMLTSPEGVTQRIILNEHEHPISLQAGADVPTTLAYDSLGRLVESSQGGRDQVRYGYNDQGYISVVTNARNETTRYGYDLAGRNNLIILPDLRMIKMGYDRNGNLVSVTPPERSPHVFNFNSFNSLSEYLPPLIDGVNSQTRYFYNLDKQLIKIIKPDRQSVELNYNAVTAQLESLHTPQGQSHYLYHQNHGLLQSSSSSDGIQNEYQYYGPYISTISQKRLSDGFLFGKIQVLFDSEHRPMTFKIQGHSGDGITTLPMNYNQDNQIASAGPLSLAYGLPSGRLTKTVLGNILDIRTYDAFGSLSSFTVQKNSSNLKGRKYYSYTLQRDLMGRISSKTDSLDRNSFDYVYDSSGRLVEVRKNRKLWSTYSYDGNGNRLRGTIDGISRVATYDAQDRLKTYGSTVYTYTPNGDLSSKTDSLLNATTYFGYDLFGSLKSVTKASNEQITYYTDALHRRVAKAVNGTVLKRWLYDAQSRVVAELDGSGNLQKTFVYASQSHVPDYMILNGKNYKIISDHLGSVRQVMEASRGRVLQELSYDEFGQVLKDSNPGFQPFGFAGGLYDPDTGLVRFGARDYDAETGRWLSKDPILFDGQDTNLYGYVFQDPVNFIDPSGKLFEKLIAKYTTPKQQAALGAATGAVGAALMYGSFNPFAPLTFSIGAYLGYEGSANVINASKRGFVNDIMNDIIPRAEAGENKCPQGN